MSGRAGTSRAEKERRRKARKAKKAVSQSLGDGWHTMDELDMLPDSAFEPPDKALFDTTHCPVDDICAGCGATNDLRVNTASIGDVNATACATVCADCDGRSFLHLLSDEQLDRAFHLHAQHLNEAVTR